MAFSDYPSGTRPQMPAREDSTVISGGPPAASWSGFATGPAPGGLATTADIGRALAGTMLGPYRLDQFVGGGGMGAVFRALDTTLDRTVAVKVLAGRQADDEEMLKRFRNEAQSAARLDHENIGRVYAVGSEHGWHYIVFEFIEGTNLRDLVREEGPFDLARTVDITIQVADALEHASERDVVHRDIKPSNIVITPTGRARIVDMGLARLPQMAEDGDLTVSGMTLGTFDYISPEQARDPRAADVRSDLYSLGCTIFYTLTGRPPFADGTMVQKLLQHQQAQPPALDEIRSDVPRRFADIVSRLMEKDPLDRYQRPAVLVADLVAFAEDHGVSLASPRPATPAVMSSTPRRLPRLPWLVPLVVLLAVVAAMWLRSAADRQAVLTVGVISPTVEGSVLGDVVRVVSGSPADGEAASLGDAMRRVADGGVIELAYDGPRREPPIALAGRSITLRAAAGMNPIIDFIGTSDHSDGPQAACDIGDGELTIRGVAIRTSAGGNVAALFALQRGRLSCNDVTLRMPSAPAGSRPVSATPPRAFVTATAAEGDGPTACTIVLERTRAAGDANFLDASGAGPGRVILRWSDGAFVSPGRLIVSDGTTVNPLDIECEFDGVAVACAAGVALLRDSAVRAVPARLRMRAADSRFVVADPSRPFLEQAGRADVDVYRAACGWLDEQSRYEGGDCFRRIDAATERVDESVRDVSPPLFHDPIVGLPPDPTAWRGWDG